ncbi:MAG: hypothetical protein H0T62_03450 [Parachlamydiaceae bacterium]|nr:hypothetical protein [Parachlamydiaceae bacterium]
MIKFALSKEQRLHFEKHHFLEIEGMLESEQLQLLKNEIHGLTRQSSSKIDEWVTLSETEKQYANGRDLWRKSTAIKKFALSKQLAKIASDLTGIKFLRFGYDQFLPSIALPAHSTPEESTSKYSFWIKKKAPLGEHSSIQGVVSGLLLCLNNPESEFTVPSVDNSIFSSTAGNIIFFSSEKEVNFSELQKRPGQEFFLITYAEKVSIYVHNENDPHLHAFKQLGYVFGDRLKDDINPVLCR